jgi:hypothetical protein
LIAVGHLSELCADANPILSDATLDDVQLHRDEIVALTIADFVDTADVRMIQRRRGTRLVMEALGRGSGTL